MLAPGLVTTIGSLPHAGIEDAVRFVLEGDPALPAAPQLPGHDRREGMLAQVGIAIPGVTVGPGGGLIVDPEVVIRSVAAAGVDPSTDRRGAEADPLEPSAFAGTLAFLGACAAAGRRGPVKLQLAGPVTLAVALVQAGVPPHDARAAALDGVVTTAGRMIEAARAALPGAELACWLDEPGLASAGLLTDDVLAVDVVVTDLVRGALAALGPDVMTGVHCCGAIDWASVVDAGPGVVSMPVDIEPPAGTTIGRTLDRHLQGDGWIAWGAVPTDRVIDERDEEALWHELLGRWDGLAALGCDPLLLRRRAIVTPACGLAGLDVAAAATVVELTRRLGLRVAGSTA